MWAVAERGGARGNGSSGWNGKVQKMLWTTDEWVDSGRLRAWLQRLTRYASKSGQHFHTVEQPLQLKSVQHLTLTVETTSTTAGPSASMPKQRPSLLRSRLLTATTA